MEKFSMTFVVLSYGIMTNCGNAYKGWYYASGWS